MKEKLRLCVREWSSILLQTMVLVGIVVFAIVPLSCKVTTEGIEVIGGDYVSPVLENVTVIDDSSVQISFSKKVDLTDIVISPFVNGFSDSMVHSENESLSYALAAACGEYGKLYYECLRSEDGRQYTFMFDQKTEVGKNYEIFGCVHDPVGNSLTFCVPFKGYNSRVPQLLLSELQVRYTKASLKTGVVYRSEYVEILSLSDGNLAGVELISASDGESKKYSFPPIEVKQGQIFVVHLRSAGEGCINESENFTEAFAEYSNDDILDLWSDNNSARLNDETDVVILRSSTENTILDGIMYAGENETEWKSNVADYAIMLEECGIYDSIDICNASCSKGVSPKKSLQRTDIVDIYNDLIDGIEIEYPVHSTCDTWYVSETTPGVL